MKQNDIMLLIGAVVVGLITSIIASKYIFSTPSKLSQSVDVVPVISTNFTPPSPQHFNSSAVDPTTIININQNSNTNVF